MNNTTSARGLLVLLEAIAKGEAVDPDSSRQMVEILSHQKFNEAIPAGLPPGTRIAHKTGEVTKIHHDAAIVFAPRPFILVVQVRGMAESKDSAGLMADIARRNASMASLSAEPTSRPFSASRTRASKPGRSIGGNKYGSKSFGFIETVRRATASPAVCVLPT